MERGKLIAHQFFEELGFQVDNIPETDTKRADLNVNDGQQQYIVEVKEKLDTGRQLTVLPHSIPNSDRKMTREPHAPLNRLDGILKDGRKQLTATPANNDALRLIFLMFRGPNADMFVRRSLYTFYGVQILRPVSKIGDVISVSENGHPNCVYFHNSFSFSSPNVDGLLLLENDYPLLCINEFSASCEVLRQSLLVRKMGGATFDPATFEDLGHIVLRSAVSRSDERVVLDELERISGIRYEKFAMNRISG